MTMTIFDAKRDAANKELVSLISGYLAKNPGMRFNQALVYLNAVVDESDDFYTEPWVVLERVKKRLAEIT